MSCKVLSGPEWRERLKALLPGWIFCDNPKRVNAVLGGIGAVISAVHEDILDNVEQTFIDKSVGEYLDLHAKGRGQERLQDETDRPLRARIKNLQSTTTCRAIKEVVDAALVNGESRIVEGDELTSFLDRESFIDVNLTLSGLRDRYNFFSVRIDPQIPVPNAYWEIDSFLDSNLFLGTHDSESSVLRQVIRSVEEVKAFGIQWELRESEEGDVERLIALASCPDETTNLAVASKETEDVCIEIRR